MKLFSENLTAKYREVHLFRGGPVADHYGADWLYSALCCSMDGTNCILLGFSTGGAPVDVVYRLVRLAIAEARRLGYRGRVDWERSEDGEMRAFTVPERKAA